MNGFSPKEIERLNQMSEEKNQLDLQSEFVYARREGEAKGRLEGEEKLRLKLLDFIAKGHSLEDIKNEFASR